MDIAIYLRKSRAEESTDTVEETLRKHKEILLKFAAGNGLIVQDIFEEVYTGDSLYSRPEMLKLLEAVEEGKYDAVLCMDIDRLGRGGMREQGIILDTFKYSRTKIITPRKVYDLNDELDEEYTEFETFMARRELKIIKRRLRRGLQKTIEEGGYTSNPPYGYEREFVNKKPTLKIKESEAAFVRMMFDMYVNQGMGCQMIAYAVNSMGAKPHRSKEFGRTSIMKILRNPAYIGKIVWNQKQHIRKGVKGNEKTIIIYNPPEKWIVTDGIHPPIVDEDLFQKAQEIFKSRYHPPSNKGIVENPLAGIVRCANCGSIMQRNLPHGKSYYLACMKKGCIASTKLDYVEQAILKALQHQMKELKVQAKAAKKKPKTNYSAILTEAENDLAQLRSQLDSLHDLLEQGAYDIDTFLTRQKKLGEKISRQKEVIQEIKTKQEEKPEVDYKATAATLSDVLKEYPNCTAQRKNQLLRSVIDHAEYYKEKGWKSDQFDLTVTLKRIYK